MLPMKVGARPWHSMYTVMVRFIVLAGWETLLALGTEDKSHPQYSKLLHHSWELILSKLLSYLVFLCMG
jgi:hypothetical protein